MPERLRGRPRRATTRVVILVLAVVVLVVGAFALVRGLRDTDAPSGAASADGAERSRGATDDGEGHTFPTAADVGVPAGWEPTEVITGDHWVWEEGAVLEDVRIVSGTLHVRAHDVTVRRVEFVDSAIRVLWDECYNGLTVEDSSFLGTALPQDSHAVVWPGGYTARGVLVDGPPEGLRVGGASRGCGPVTIEDSVVHSRSPQPCDGLDWHGDALQATDGAELTVRDTVLQLTGDFAGQCGGNSPFFYPDQDNTSVTIDGLVVSGGGFSFRLETPGTVERLYVVDGSWEFGPTQVTSCDRVTTWDAHLATLDDDGQPVAGAPLACG